MGKPPNTGCGGSFSIPQDTYLANQGLLELSNRNYLGAEANLLVALDLNPNNPYALLNLGVVYHNTDRPAEAVEMYLRVLDLKPEETAVESNREGNRGRSLLEIAKDEGTVEESITANQRQGHLTLSIYF
jgi:tetratricopeptide (TPR) repeat protein